MIHSESGRAGGRAGAGYDDGGGWGGTHSKHLR